MEDISQLWKNFTLCVDPEMTKTELYNLYSRYIWIGLWILFLLRVPYFPVFVALGLFLLLFMGILDDKTPVEYIRPPLAYPLKIKKLKTPIKIVPLKK